MWSWGDGDYGKLGRGGSDGCKTPKLIEKLQDLDIVKVHCGSQFSIALTKDGQVYTWGKGDNQRLGHGTEEHVRYPKLLESLKGNYQSWKYSKVLSAVVGAFYQMLMVSTLRMMVACTLSYFMLVALTKVIVRIFHHFCIYTFRVLADLEPLL